MLSLSWREGSGCNWIVWELRLLEAMAASVVVMGEIGTESKVREAYGGEEFEQRTVVAQRRSLLGEQGFQLLRR